MSRIIHMNSFNRLVCIAISVSCLCCTSENERIENKFRDLNTAVLSAFKGDSLKTVAAIFTLEHLYLRSHEEGEIVKVYTDTIEKYANQRALQEIALTALDKKSKDLKRTSKRDVDFITADYLIRHINLAVDNYINFKWYQEVPFDKFCNYVLPYQIHTEYPCDWISYYQQQYFLDNDSSILNQPVIKRSLMIAEWMMKRKKEFRVSTLFMPDISAEVADKLLYGSCHDLTKVNISALRAFGIPVVNDFTPFYSNRDGEHEWTVILHHDSIKMINMANARLEADTDTTERFFSKVYRNSFKRVEGNFFAKKGVITSAPSHLNDPYIEDVTSDYYKTFDLDIPLSTELKGKVGYLAVFTRQHWAPFTWGESDKHTLHFKNLRGNAVYLPLLTEPHQILSPPVLLTASGEALYLEADLSHVETVHLTRKYPLFNKIRSYVSRMVGGKFEGSNDPDFKNAQVLYTIASDPGANYNRIILRGNEKFRYVRYIGPPSAQCNVGEIAFYEAGKNTPLEGKIIGTAGAWDNNQNRELKAAFDGDPLTFFDYKNPDGGWVGLDLGSAKLITKIHFIARTDVNIVEIGTNYELFYWKDGWKSLGKKIATSDTLTYDNVPQKSLLWLRNLKGGTEERIFQYENGQQVWR